MWQRLISTLAGGALIILSQASWAQENNAVSAVVVLVDDKGAISYYRAPPVVDDWYTAGGLFSDLIPLDPEQFLDDLGSSLVDQARYLVCEQPLRPQTISVTVSLGVAEKVASSVELTGSWETEKLCVVGD